MSTYVSILVDITLDLGVQTLNILQLNTLVEIRVGLTLFYSSVHVGLMEI